MTQQKSHSIYYIISYSLDLHSSAFVLNFSIIIRVEYCYNSIPHCWNNNWILILICSFLFLGHIQPFRELLKFLHVLLIYFSLESVQPSTKIFACLHPCISPDFTYLFISLLKLPLLYEYTSVTVSILPTPLDGTAEYSLKIWHYYYCAFTENQHLQHLLMPLDDAGDAGSENSSTKQILFFFFYE